MYSPTSNPMFPTQNNAQIPLCKPHNAFSSQLYAPCNPIPPSHPIFPLQLPSLASLPKPPTRPVSTSGFAIRTHHRNQSSSAHRFSSTPLPYHARPQTSAPATASSTKWLAVATMATRIRAGYAKPRATSTRRVAETGKGREMERQGKTREEGREERRSGMVARVRPMRRE